MNVSGCAEWGCFKLVGGNVVKAGGLALGRASDERYRGGNCGDLLQSCWCVDCGGVGRVVVGLDLDGGHDVSPFLFGEVLEEGVVLVRVCGNDLSCGCFEVGHCSGCFLFASQAWPVE